MICLGKTGDWQSLTITDIINIDMINMIYKDFSVCIKSRYDQHLVKLHMIW
jgi:hypothetical protein